jgi:hypothetical protein
LTQFDQTGEEDLFVQLALFNDNEIFDPSEIETIEGRAVHTRQTNEREKQHQALQMIW